MSFNKFNIQEHNLSTYLLIFSRETNGGAAASTAPPLIVS